MSSVPNPNSDMVEELLQQQKEYVDTGLQLPDTILNQVVTAETPVTPSLPPELVDHLEKFLLQLSGTHNISSVSTPNVDIIAELLQQQKEYFAADEQLPDRIPHQVVQEGTPVAPNLLPEVAVQLGNPTSLHSPTTSANLSSEIRSHHIKSLHLKHPSQSTLIIPTHPSIPSHPDMCTQQKSHIKTVAIKTKSRHVYAVPTNSYNQPTDHLQLSVMDAKSKWKIKNDVSKAVQETRDMDNKVLHLGNDDDHAGNHIPAHDIIPIFSTIKPHTMHQQQHAATNYSMIHQLRPHLTSSHKHITSLPILAIPHAAGREQAPPTSISGQGDDHNKLESSSYHYKSDDKDVKQSQAVSAPQSPSYSDTNSEQKARNDVSNIVQEIKTAALHFERNNHAANHAAQQISVPERMPTTRTIRPHSLHRQLLATIYCASKSSRIAVASREYIKQLLKIANQSTGRRRTSQIPVSRQVGNHNGPESSSSNLHSRSISTPVSSQSTTQMSASSSNFTSQQKNTKSASSSNFTSQRKITKCTKIRI